MGETGTVENGTDDDPRGEAPRDEAADATEPAARAARRTPLLRTARAKIGTVALAVITSVIAGVLTDLLPPYEDDGPRPTPTPSTALFATADRDWGKLRAGALLATTEPLDLESFPSEPGVASTIRRAYRAGAVDARTSYYKVVLENAFDETATITDAEVRFLQRSPVDPTSYLLFESAGGAESTVLYFNLDDPAPRALAYDLSADRALGPYFSGRAITLAPDESVPLYVVANARDYDCTWRLELTVVRRGATHQMVVDLDGEPFRTMGSNGDAPIYTWTWYEPNEERFVPYEGQQDLDE